MSDPRLILAREDLADAALQGLVKAERFEKTEAYHCAIPAAAIRNVPDDSAEQVDQLLFGETFHVLEIDCGWAWGRADRDGYVGWVAIYELVERRVTATHRISALRAYAFTEPSIKSRPGALLSLNALVEVEAEEGRFLKVHGPLASLWIPTAQLAPIGLYETDPAAVAERFLGAPYQWGGRESLGLDCSGLVQQALHACGRYCPRDSDQQQALGRPIDATDVSRNDLVFWPGHVGMMLDGVRLLHANAFHMQVAVEPLAEAIARIGEPVACRRP